MHASWTTVKLADIATIQGGATPSRAEAAYFGGDIPWVTPTDLPPIGRIAVLGDVAELLTKAGLVNSSAKLIAAGSVLFSSRASIGKIAVTDRECATNQGFINLTPKADAVCPWFLAYLLARYTYELRALAGKTTFLEIPRSKFKEFEVAIPPLLEQHRIVARIKECTERVEEIESLRASAQIQQQHLSASVIESELHSDLTSDESWSVRNVGELVTSIRNGRSIGQDTDGRADGAVLTLTAVRGVDLGIEFQKPIALPEKIVQQFGIDEGDVFVSRANTIELVGLAAVAEEKPAARLIYPDLLIKLKADRAQVLPRYLAYALRSAGARKQIKARALGSSQTMVKISGERLQEINLPVPSLKKQALIVSRLDAAHELIRCLGNEFKSAEIFGLRASILRKAFAGEL
jgi:type I restriction enzyme, S subunit